MLKYCLNKVASSWRAVMGPTLTSHLPLGSPKPISEAIRVVDKKKNVLVCRIFTFALHAVYITSKCTVARPWYPIPSLGIPPKRGLGEYLFRVPLTLSTSNVWDRWEVSCLPLLLPPLHLLLGEVWWVRARKPVAAQCRRTHTQHTQQCSRKHLVLSSRERRR